jgi:hypothetical protein
MCSFVFVRRSKYKTHDPEAEADAGGKAHTEEEKGLMGAVKHAGDALSKTMGGGK